MPDNNKPVGKLTPYNPTESKSNSVAPIGKLTPVDATEIPHIDVFKGESEDTDEAKVNTAIDFIRKQGGRNGSTIMDSELSVLKDVLINPKATEEQRKNAILTIQGYDPKHDDDNTMYYNKREENGVYMPVALAYGEKPPKGYDVASVWGNQKEANDDSWYTDLGKSMANGVLNAVKGTVDLANVFQTEVTGEESKYLNKVSNTADALKFEKDEALDAPIFNTEGIQQFSDLLDKDRFDLSPQALWGTLNMAAESLTSFGLGAKGAGAIMGAKPAIFTGSFITQLSDNLDNAEEAGLEGRDKASVASAITAQMASLDAFFGLDGKIMSSVFKDAKKEIVKNAIKEVEKDAAGNITEKGFKELAKYTTVGYAQLAKNGIKEVVKDVVGEGTQEAAQDFTQKASEQLWDKMTEGERGRFGTDAFDAKSFGDYVNSFAMGLVSGAPMSLASSALKDRSEEQSNNIYGRIKEGEEATRALKTDLVQAFKGGKITQQELENANFKIDSYKKYHEETKGIDLAPEDEKRAFQLSFQIEGLKTEIPNTPEEFKKLDPIPLAKVKSKQDMVNDLQKELNEVLLKGQVKEEPVVAKKTEEKIVKAKEKENKVSEVDALLKRFGKTKPVKADEGVDLSGVNIESEVKPQRLKFAETPAERFNVLNDLQKKQVIQEHLKYTPDKAMEGFIEEGQNKKLHVNLGDGKYIVLAQSVESTEGKKDNIIRENLPKTKELGKIKDAEGQPLISFKEPVVVKREEILAFDDKGKPVKDEEGNQKKKAIINVYNGETGKYIVSVRENKFGKSKYTPKEVEQMQSIIAKANGTKEENVSLTDEGNKSKKVEKTEVKPSEKSEKVSEKKPKDNKEQGLRLKSKIQGYNQLSYAEKKSDFGINLRKEIQKEVNEFGGSLKPLRKNKVQLLDSNGKRISKTPTVRGKDEIAEEKYAREQRKKALNTVPTSIRQYLAMIVGRGGAFNESATKEKVDVPYLMQDKENGYSLESLYQGYKEESGIDNISEEDFNDEVEDILSDYLIEGGRLIAIKYAKEAYEREINGGFTDKEIEDKIAEGEGLGLSRKEAEIIFDAVQDLNKEELTELEIKIENTDEKDRNEKSANETIKDIAGTEGSSDNPFDEMESEQDREEAKDIIRGDSSEFEPFQKKSSNRENIQDGKEEYERFSSAFEKVKKVIENSFKGITVVSDSSKFTGDQSKIAGKVSVDGKTIYLNPNYAGLDTPIHEAGHVLIDALGYDNKIVQAAFKQLKGTDLYNETKLAYPELSEQELNKEVLAEAIGREGAGIFDNEADKSKFRQYLDYIFDWFKRKLGLDKNIAKSLAKQIIAGIGTKGLKGTNTGKEQLAKRSKRKNPMNVMPASLYRTNFKFRNLKQEEKDLATIEKYMNDDSLSEADKAKLNSIKEKIESIQERDKKDYKRYLRDIRKINDIREAEDLSQFNYDELLELFDTIKNLDPNAKDALLNDVKARIAYSLFKQGADRLKEHDSFVEDVAKRKDINGIQSKMKVLSHFTEDNPEMQEFGKIADDSMMDMITETNDELSENEALARKVIEEKNKSLVGKAKGLFVSDNAKYFEYLENPKAIEVLNEEGDIIGYKAGYWTIQEAKDKGFSKAQINYLKFVRDTIAKRKQLEDANNEEIEVVKLDKGFQEAYATSGAVEALSYYLGGGRTNLSSVRIDYKGKPASFGEIEADIIKQSKKGTISKIKAIAEIAFYNYHARKQLKKGFNVDEKENPMDVKGDSQYSLNPDGKLTSKFDRARNSDRGYSKDFFRAMNEYIHETNHVKHMDKLMPVINSLEYMAKNGYEVEGIAKKENLATWIDEWRKMHIFKESKANSPEIDIMLKFLRKLTSMTTMMFNVPAQAMNAFMGVYNNFRSENLATLKTGYTRLFGDRSKAEKNRGVINKYAEDIIRKYSIVSLDLDSNPRPFIGEIFQRYGMMLTKWGEYQTQGSLALGLLSDEDYNSFEYKKDANGVEKLVIKEGVDEKGLKQRINNAKNRVSDIQGKYADKDRRNIMRGELGKAVFQFKVWIPDWWKERFGAEYIDRNNVVRKGSWNIVTRKGLQDLKRVVNKKGWKKGLFDGETPESRAFLSNLKGMMAVAVFASFKYGDDDDDDKRRKAFTADNALAQLLFIFDPEQLKYTVKNPAAIIGTTTRFIDTATDLITLEEDKAGNAKIVKDIVELVPGKKLIKGIEELASEE
jgi:hypothetical protein